MILKYVWKRPGIVKAILKKNKTGRFTIPDLLWSYRNQDNMVLAKSRHTDQGNRRGPTQM